MGCRPVAAGGVRRSGLPTTGSTGLQVAVIIIAGRLTAPVPPPSLACGNWGRRYRNGAPRRPTARRWARVAGPMPGGGHVRCGATESSLRRRRSVPRRGHGSRALRRARRLARARGHAGGGQDGDRSTPRRDPAEHRPGNAPAGNAGKGETGSGAALRHRQRIWADNPPCSLQPADRRRRGAGGCPRRRLRRRQPAGASRAARAAAGLHRQRLGSQGPLRAVQHAAHGRTAGHACRPERWSLRRGRQPRPDHSARPTGRRAGGRHHQGRPH